VGRRQRIRAVLRPVTRAEDARIGLHDHAVWGCPTTADGPTAGASAPSSMFTGDTIPARSGPRMGGWPLIGAASQIDEGTLKLAQRIEGRARRTDDAKLVVNQVGIPRGLEQSQIVSTRVRRASAPQPGRHVVPPAGGGRKVARESCSVARQWPESSRGRRARAAGGELRGQLAAGAGGGARRTALDGAAQIIAAASNHVA